MIVPIQSKVPIIPNQARCIKALLNKDINNLSPLVVSRPMIPFLGFPPGSFFSHIIIIIKHNAINTKKAAAGSLTIIPGAFVIYFVRNYIAKGFALGRV